MNKCDKKLIKLIDYIEYLLSNEYLIYYRLNKRHIKKINKLLKEFSKEYIKKEWK